MTEGATILENGELRAEVWPGRGMLVSSLRHRGIELLRLVDDIEGAAATGRSIGIPLLHPWANRLSRTTFDFDGRNIALDAESPLVTRDWNDIVIHGVAWSRLAWTVVDRGDDAIRAQLEWDRPALLDVFPFPHRIEMEIGLLTDAIEIRVHVHATTDGAVPVSFGFHPQVALPGIPREQWRLTTPPMRRRILDALLLPTGDAEPFLMDGPLGQIAFDDGFDLLADASTISLSGLGRTLHFEFLEGYRFLQIYAQPEHDRISIDPMVAPTDALVTGESLPRATPGHPVSAAFRIRIE